MQRDRRLDQAITQLACVIVEAKQLFAQEPAIRQRKGPHGAHRVGGQTAFDLAAGNRRVPLGVTVEIAQPMPDLFDRRGDDGAFAHPGHVQRPPKLAPSALNAAWNTPLPICSTSAASRSGAQSKSACHWAKVTLPSVTGVSVSLAT